MAPGNAAPQPRFLTFEPHKAAMVRSHIKEPCFPIVAVFYGFLVVVIGYGLRRLVTSGLSHQVCHVCYVHYHVCYVHYHVCYVHYHVCYVHYHVCYVHYHVCYVHYHVCYVHYHVCYVHYHVCYVHYHVCYVHYHVCYVHYHVCYVHYHVCYVHYHVCYVHSHVCSSRIVMVRLAAGQELDQLPQPSDVTVLSYEEVQARGEGAYLADAFGR